MESGKAEGRQHLQERLRGGLPGTKGPPGSRLEHPARQAQWHEGSAIHLLVPEGPPALLGDFWGNDGNRSREVRNGKSVCSLAFEGLCLGACCICGFVFISLLKVALSI